MQKIMFNDRYCLTRMAVKGIFAGRNWCKGAAMPDCIDYAQDAVKLADALLEELEKPEKKL